MTVDVLITGGTVVDGSGAPLQRADVAISGGRIVNVGRVDEPARERIDADGLIVCPGFIDSHTHLDGQFFWDPLCTPASWHGSTSVVMGNCGFTLSCHPDHAEYALGVMTGVEQIPRELLQSQVPFDWEDFGGYVDSLQRHGMGINAAAYAGYPLLRYAAMGERALEEQASPAELDALERQLRDALLGGALGLSFNRFPGDRDDRRRHVAGWNADWSEMRRLCAVLGEHEGTLVQSLPCWFGEHEPSANSEELQQWIQVLQPLRGRPMVWGPLTDERFDYEIGFSERAARNGARIVAGSHPVPIAAMSCFLLGNVFERHPEWLFLFKLDIPERLRALADPAVRARLRASMPGDMAAVYFGTTFDAAGQVDKLGVPIHFPWSGAHYVGQAPEPFNIQGPSLAEQAAASGRAPVDVMLDTVLETQGRAFFYMGMSRYDAAQSLAVLRHPGVVISGNDTGAHLQRVCQQASSLLLGHYVRRLGVLPVEEAVHWLTGRQAEIFQLKDRGLLRPGMAADVVLFDPERIGTVAPEVAADLPGGTERMLMRSTGIERVLVNGSTILNGGEPTGALPGRFLRPADMARAAGAGR